MQKHIEELRAERHRLANEAMRATAFEAKLSRVTEERDRLKADLEVVRVAVEKKGEEMMAVLQNRDRRIAELVVEIVALRRQLEENRKPAAGNARVAPSEATSHEDVVVDTTPAAPTKAWSRTLR
jgi:septal ring factor EnvC (AmiA/AmiB activator)